MPVLFVQFITHVHQSHVDLAVLLRLPGFGVTMVSDELIDWDNNKVMDLKSEGHSITTILIRTPQQLFEEIMLSEASVCKANWVAFFIFVGLNLTFDLHYPKHGECVA